MEELANVVSRFDSIDLLIAEFKALDTEIETIEELTECLEDELERANY